MICVLTLINHPLQRYSPWRLTPRGSFSQPPTHNHTTLADGLRSSTVKSLLEIMKCHVGEREFTDFSTRFNVKRQLTRTVSPDTHAFVDLRKRAEDFGLKICVCAG